ncbi:MAG: response regulator [Candidatus Omnitrophota bacterium]
MIDTRKKNILLVEDEDDSRQLMAKKLESRGYHVLQAADGNDALEIAKNNPLDLIITDIIMPHMDGNQLIKELSNLHSCKNIPIIVITVRKNMKDYFETLGAVGFIAKPFSPETLIMQVRGVLEQPEKKKEAIDMQKRILVSGAHIGCVEDICETLREAGYHVDFVPSSEQIISKAVLFLPDLLIFETQMVGVPLPHEVIKIVRQMPQFKRTPILIYSKCDSEGQKKLHDAFYQEKLNAIACANRCLDEGATENMGMLDKGILLGYVAKYLRKGTVIVIDDDKGMLLLLKNKLEAQGCHVLTAVDGEKGIELIRRIKPDLILLDILMPKIGGYEVLGVLEQDPIMREIPVIMLTVKSEESDIQKALDLGARDYIIKPFHAELLLKRIENYLQQP